MSRSTTGQKHSAATTGLHPGRRLRKPQRPAMQVIGVRSVQGDELFQAVAFLSAALHLPSLAPSRDNAATALSLAA